MERPRIALIGSGNVATHLSHALELVADVAQIYSRDISHSQRLAETIPGCRAISSLGDIDTEADFVILSVTDNTIAEIAESLPPIKGIVAHTSGSIPLDALLPAERRAVIYPLQTFSRDVAVNMKEVPFFTEANDEDTLKAVDELSAAIGGKISHADSAQRTLLHISAVFACNFANHLWTLAAKALEEHGYDFSVLRPLLNTTLQKAFTVGPEHSQTGPAARGDTKVLNKHKEMLDGLDKEIYELLSQSIYNHSTKKT